ncbi:MAG: alpha/beta hydrolase [Gemmatimonadaceae bacterium]
MTQHWAADSILPDYDVTVLPLPAEDDGELVATLLRKSGEGESRRAFLYVHGYLDYFFHDHVAAAVCEAGFDFYALELRRYGRSLRGGNRPNYCTSLDQYFVEITQAIDIAIADGHDRVVLYGHSTGGLIVSLYADRGDRRARLSAVVLNSPFFEFAITSAQRRMMWIALLLGGIAPWLSDRKGLPPHYGESLHKSKRGEWEYDLRWKPIRGFPTYFGWVRAIKQGHKQVQRGLSIEQPVLLLQSDTSGGGKEWSDDFFTRDIVLKVAHMRAYGDGLGAHVTRTEIPGAIHDVMLSRAPVRQQALALMVHWISTNVPARTISASPSLA